MRTAGREQREASAPRIFIWVWFNQVKTICNERVVSIQDDFSLDSLQSNVIPYILT